MTCGDVAAYLDAFLDHEARARFDVASLSEHAGGCASCATRLAGFFRVLEIPQSAYLRETLDELAIAMHGLALAVIRERVDPEANTDNMVPVAAPEGASEDLARQGAEMVDDAEDWAGSSRVSGHDMAEFRDVIDDAARSRERKLDVAAKVCEAASRVATRHLPRVLNLLGAVRLWQSDVDAAEAAFLRTLACRDADEDGRRAQVFAHVNLAYVQRQRRRWDAADLSARRAVALAEELGEDPLFGLFAQLCIAVDRVAESGVGAVERVVARLIALPSGTARLRDALALENNKPVRDALRDAGIGASHPALFDAER